MKTYDQNDILPKMSGIVLDCFAQNDLMGPRSLMGGGGLSRARSLLLTAITDNQDMIGFGHRHLHTSQFTIINIKPLPFEP